MRKLETQLVTSDNQFGFKHEHGLDLCIFTVKSVIKYYNLHNSPGYTCFLDASKAYDRVNHWTLFRNYSTDQFIFLLLESICIGTLSNNYILDGELKCRHVLLFLTLYVALYTIVYNDNNYCLR